MKIIFLLLFFVFSSGNIFAEKIGLLVMATGKYISFVEPLIVSAEKYFCKNHDVTYFIFTDSNLASTDRVMYLYQPRLGWPFDTMMRFHVYDRHRDLLAGQDYLFACDADMLFVAEVGEEILSQRVATLHPGFLDKEGSYETDPISTAYVSPKEGKYYFAGGFYGGTAEEVLKAVRINAEHVDEDLKKGYIAVWHDESHWNRYCIDHQPTLILSPSYCYPETVYSFFPKELGNYSGKLLALDKNHEEVRREIP